ncbi:MAG: acyl-CoA reductase [Clostridiales bacterium]|nr:acyl-CoA reductase [Clostridiales bacterium]
MILYAGKTYDSTEQNRLLDELKGRITETLAKEPLDPGTVIDAIDKLRQDTLAGKFDDLLVNLPQDAVASYKTQAAVLLSKDMLRLKMKTELGDTGEYETDGAEGFSRIKVKTMPLGVILHIAAGNMDFLPAYSLAEGLLTGNINILKLPSADDGLSLKLIMQLIEYEPQLKDYIYVFDTPSSDVFGMKKMAELSNGISVWGSDIAIDAVRKMAPTGVKLIEWGQKLGFCYISHPDLDPDADEDLRALASHIAETKQLLCSSCQVIYINSDIEEEKKLFAQRFAPLLEDAVGRNKTDEIGVRARDTLVSYTARLKGMLGEEAVSSDVIRKRGCSVIISADSKLELSPMMCNVLVKSLPEDKMTKVLTESKNYLQTAGLICPDYERARLTDALLKSGLIRVTKAGNMSAYFPGESHDGEYALSRYVRRVNVEI